MISGNVPIKGEHAASAVKKQNKTKNFPPEEDMYLKPGIKKYGLKSWSSILKYSAYKFQPTRTRDFLRMRATSSGFRKNNK